MPSYITPSVDYTVSVANTSTHVVNENLRRAELTLVNDSDEVIYLAKGRPAASNTGIRINANGGSYVIDKNNPFFGDIYAICASGGKVLCVQETSYGY